MPKCWYSCTKCVGRESSVGMATRYGLHGLGIESRREGGTPHRSGPALGPTQLHTQWLTALSRGGKTAGCVALTTHTSCSTQVKERVQLQFYSPLWAFTVCSRVSCAFTTFTNLHCNKLRHHHVLPTFHFVFLQSSCSSRDSSASIVT